MTEQEKDRIECAIRHIESSLDVDTWARDIAVDAMQKQIPIVPLDPELGISTRHPIIIPCGNCGMELLDHMWEYCPYCGQAIDWTEGE